MICVACLPVSCRDGCALCAAADRRYADRVIFVLRVPCRVTLGICFAGGVAYMRSAVFCIALSVSGYARYLLCRLGCIYAQRGILYCVFRAGLPSVFTLRAGCFAASVFGPAEAVAADRRRGILFLCRVPSPVVCYVVRGYAAAALFRRAGVRTRCFGENYYTISGVDCQIFLHAA